MTEGKQGRRKKEGHEDIIERRKQETH